MFHSLAGAIVAVAFWAFLAVAAVSGMRYDFRKRQLAMESVRAAIERGQPLDPDLVERLLAQPHDRGREHEALAALEPNLQIGGIITLCASVGVAIASLFVGLQYPVAKYPMLGGGILGFCVGIGLVIAARSVRRRLLRAGPSVHVA
jgi:hypothetical protein